MFQSTQNFFKMFSTFTKIFLLFGIVRSGSFSVVFFGFLGFRQYGVLSYAFVLFKTLFGSPVTSPKITIPLILICFIRSDFTCVLARVFLILPNNECSQNKSIEYLFLHYTSYKTEKFPCKTFCLIFTKFYENSAYLLKNFYSKFWWVKPDVQTVKPIRILTQMWLVFNQSKKLTKLL